MLKLHGHVNRLSPTTLKLRVALAEVGAAYEYVPVDLAKREQLRPEFLALNPHGKIPVLVDDEFVLPESDAILWYIGETFPEAGLVGASPRQRALTLSFCDLASTALYAAYYDIYFHTKGGPAEQRLVAIAESGQKKFDRVLGVLDKVLAERTFLAGALSIADLSAAAVLRAAKERVPYEASAHPAIERWYDRVTARPSWRAATAA